MGNTPFSGLSDAQLEEALVKYDKVPSIKSSLLNEKKLRGEEQAQAQARLEAEATVELAKLARQKEIDKIVKGLGKVWTDDLTNVLVTREDVDDIEHPEETEVTKDDGSKVMETRYPKVKGIKVRTNIFWSEARGETPKVSKAGGKRLAKKVYRKGTEPLELVLDGSKVDAPLTTWTACIRYLNENPHLLRHDDNGRPIPIAETSASGLVDLKTAGFIGIEG